MSEENPRVLAALLNLEPTGGLEPPAFSLPRKCWWNNFSPGPR